MSAIIKEKIIEALAAAEPAEKSVSKVDALGRAYASGGRKNATARVWIKKGTGKVKVNARDAKTYFGREILINIFKAPFLATKTTDKFDIFATISGGGLSGQAGALSNAISKALVAFDSNNHKVLRAGGFLTRDPRVVERKKYGLKKARKAQTYRKR